VDVCAVPVKSPNPGVSVVSRKIEYLQSGHIHGLNLNLRNYTSKRLVPKNVREKGGYSIEKIATRRSCTRQFVHVWTDALGKFKHEFKSKEDSESWKVSSEDSKS
jgi:hypothetical protein